MNRRRPRRSPSKWNVSAPAGGSASGPVSQERANAAGSAYCGDGLCRDPATCTGCVRRASARMPASVIRASYGQIIEMLVDASVTLSAASIRVHAVISRAERPAHTGSARMRTRPPRGLPWRALPVAVERGDPPRRPAAEERGFGVVHVPAALPERGAEQFQVGRGGDGEHGLAERQPFGEERHRRVEELAVVVVDAGPVLGRPPRRGSPGHAPLPVAPRGHRRLPGRLVHGQTRGGVPADDPQHVLPAAAAPHAVPAACAALAVPSARAAPRSRRRWPAARLGRSNSPRPC